MFSHKRRSSREFHPNKEGEYAEQSDRALQGEQEALSKLYETEIQTTILLEEQRSQMLSEAKFELLLQETRAEHAFRSIQNLNNQLRSQDSQIIRRRPECDAARQKHDSLRAELQSREREREYIKTLTVVPHRKWKNARERKIGAWMNFLDRNCGRVSSL